MKTVLREYLIRDIVEGFDYSELEGRGLYGLAGTLTIQPEYQRNYLYTEGKRDIAVIQSLLKGYPLGLVYFNKTADGKLEVLDGQQRITSFGRFTIGQFAVQDENQMEQYFHGLPKDKQEKILDSKILAYICEGTESEIKEWFRTINIAGIDLKPQELFNAVYSGPFVTLGKAEFSNSNNANIRKWSHYISGDARRQDFWEAALEWVSSSKGKELTAYMSDHRYDADIAEVQTYFNLVLDWVSELFEEEYREMRHLKWGELYEQYSKKEYTEEAKEALNARVKALYEDDAVKSKKGIWEYVLGGEANLSLLQVRLFDDKMKKIAYDRQTAEAKEKKISNCSICALGKNANRTKIWARGDMDADHVEAWSKGGKTELDNCEMLCSPHNRGKGNS